MLVVSGNKCTLYDSDNRPYVLLSTLDGLSSHLSPSRLASGKPYGIEGAHKLAEGVEFTLGSKEIEIDHQLSRQDFLSGKCFGRGGISDNAVALSRPAASKQFIPLKPKVLNGGKNPAYIVPPVTEKEKDTIDLEPVSLANSSKAPQKSPIRDSYWTANWYVFEIW